MRAIGVIGAILACASALAWTPAFAAAAFNILQEIESADEATQRGRSQGGALDGELDDGEPRSGGAAVDPRYGPGGELSGCPGSAPGGRISLLGVQSDMGPARREGTRAVLDPRHPLWEEKKKQDSQLAALDQRLRAEAKAAGCGVPVSNKGPGPYTPDWQERVESGERWIDDLARDRNGHVKAVQNRQEQMRKASSANQRALIQPGLDNDLRLLAEADQKLAQAQASLSCLQLQQAKYESAMSAPLMASRATAKLIEERQQPCP